MSDSYYRNVFVRHIRVHKYQHIYLGRYEMDVGRILLVQDKVTVEIMKTLPLYKCNYFCCTVQILLSGSSVIPNLPCKSSDARNIYSFEAWPIIKSTELVPQNLVILQVRSQNIQQKIYTWNHQKSYFKSTLR